jgi:hypothetical protein
MRTYSTGFTADVESTAVSSSAGATIDVMRVLAAASWSVNCLFREQDMHACTSVYPGNVRPGTADQVPRGSRSRQDVSSSDPGDRSILGRRYVMFRMIGPVFPVCRDPRFDMRLFVLYSQAL